MGTLKNSNDIASMILGLHYRIEAENGFGLMTIKGLKIPRSKFDPLGCLWAAEKKRIYERFGVMSAGTFIYNEGLVSCGFFMSYADIEENDKNAITERMGVFDASFEQQMMLFKEVLELWLQDEEYGYLPFLAHINDEEPEIPALKEMMDKFLLKSGLETEADRKKSNKRKNNKNNPKNGPKDQSPH
ncbi:hypothetical protein IJH26_00615 [Candidatus Saccharibacteria bacterium]|nr:hypothetical protein [Candidatus Saccharibacteria bacterium]